MRIKENKWAETSFLEGNRFLKLFYKKIYLKHG